MAGLRPGSVPGQSSYTPIGGSGSQTPIGGYQDEQPLPPATHDLGYTGPAGADGDKDARANQEDYSQYLARLAQEYKGSISDPTSVGANSTAVAAAQAKADAAKAAYDAALAAANASTAGATSPDGKSVYGPVTRGVAPGQPGGGEVLTDPRLPELNAARDAAKAAYDAALAELNTAKTTRDPSLFSTPGTKVTAPPDVTATTIAPTSLDFNAGLVAQQIAPQQQVRAQSVGPVQGVTAQQIGIPGGVSATQVAAERIAESQITGKDVPKDIGLAGTVGRNAQLTALQQLQDAAEGKTVSAAEWLMKKGIDQNVGAAMSLGASLQGRNTGSAMRNSQIAAKDAIAKSAADMGALRAKEQADARTAFATLGTAISETDYKALASNQTKDLTVAVTNLQAKIDVAKANAANALSAGQSNQAAALNASIATMNAQLDAAKANAANALGADIATMTARLDASKADAANALNADIANQTTELNRLAANQKAALEAGERNQADMLQAEINRTNQALEAAKANQLAMLEAAKATASNILSAGTESAKLEQLNKQFNASQNLDINKTDTGYDFETEKANEAIRLALLREASGSLATGVAGQNGAPPPGDPFWKDLVKTGLVVGGTALGAWAGGPGGAVAGGAATKKAVEKW